MLIIAHNATSGLIWNALIRKGDYGGEGGIRTPDTLASMPHFECGAFNHSATSPRVVVGPVGAAH